MQAHTSLLAAVDATTSLNIDVAVNLRVRAVVQQRSITILGAAKLCGDFSGHYMMPCWSFPTTKFCDGSRVVGSMGCNLPVPLGLLSVFAPLV